MSFRATLLSAVIALATVTGARAANKPAPLAVFECVERLNITWRRTLVTYAVTFEKGRKVRAERLVLFDADGNEQLFQLTHVERRADGTLSKARVHFFAELPAGKSYRFELSQRADDAPASRPAAATDEAGDFLVLDNQRVAVRLPRAGEHRFAAPVPMIARHADGVRTHGKPAGAGIVPGPLQGVRLLDGRWVGGSYFQCDKPDTAPKVTGYTCQVAESGPLFSEASVRYTFDNGGFYTLTARLSRDDASVRFDEQYDLKTIGRTIDWRGYSPYDAMVVISLSSGAPGGWKPDHAFWGRYAYGNSMKSHKAPIEARLAELGCDFKSGDFGTHAIAYDQPANTLFGVEPWSPYGNFASYCGLVDSAALSQPADSVPFLGIVPLHAGTWRGDGPYNYKQLIAHAEGDVAMHWPLHVGPHPGSVVHTGEYDPALPYTFGRRIWALVAGPLRTNLDLRSVRSYEGYINLNNYKEWMLEWTVDPRVTYPRMLFTAADVARIKPELASHSFREQLKDRLYFKDDPKRREELWNRLGGPYGPFGVHNQTRNDLTTSFILWRQAHFAEEWLAGIDELLSSPALEPDRRAFLRARVAAYACMLSEPDFTPRGSMTSLATPNMSMIRLLALPFVASLIPDHPRAKEWLDLSEQYVRYKMAVNIAPRGGWSELFSYYDASAPNVIHAVNLLRNNGRLSDELARQASELGSLPLAFLAPVDPRVGTRTIPAWGHEGRESFGQWLPAAALTRKLDPDTHRAMLWGWTQIGRLAGYHDGNFNERIALLADDADIAARQPAPSRFQSAWIPGVGAALRAHVGSPNETYLAYRQGYMISHCDDNQGDFVLHARGAPLVDMSQFAYGMHQHEPYINLNLNFGYYSIPRYVELTNIGDMRQGANRGDTAGSWNPSSNIDAHFFAPTLDYLRGNAEYPAKPAAGNEAARGLQRCTRQILFMKGRHDDSPDYFLFRDSAQAARPGDDQSLTRKWWTIRTLGDKSTVALAPGAIHFTSAFGPKLDVRFLQPDSLRGPLPGETRDASRTGQTYMHIDRWNKDGAKPFTTNQKAWAPATETMAFTTLGPISPGEDVLCVMQPRGRDEQAVKTESLADGVVRVTTAESTDYVFTSSTPIEFKRDEVAFKGVAGAVRLFADEFHLILAEGPGEVTFRGVTLRGVTPASRVIPLAKASEKSVIEQRAATPTVAMTYNQRGDVTALAEGVKCHRRKDGYTVVIDAPDGCELKVEGVRFEGRRGVAEVDTKANTIRLTMIDGGYISAEGRAAWGAAGPYEVTYRGDAIDVKFDGPSRFLRLTRPPEMNGIPTIRLKGALYAPGVSNTVDPAQAGRSQGADSPAAAMGTLVVPLIEGDGKFEIRTLDQPPVWRNAWEW